jgi:hypothetical protein
LEFLVYYSQIIITTIGYINKYSLKLINLILSPNMEAGDPLDDLAAVVREVAESALEGAAPLPNSRSRVIPQVFGRLVAHTVPAFVVLDNLFARFVFPPPRVVQ